MADVIAKAGVGVAELETLTDKTAEGEVEAMPTLPPTVAKYTEEVAVRVPPKYPLPFTWKSDVGFVVPMPTLPEFVTAILTTGLLLPLFVTNTIGPAEVYKLRELGPP